MKIEMKYVIEKLDPFEYLFISMSTPVFKEQYKFIQNNICRGEYFLKNIKHSTMVALNMLVRQKLRNTSPLGRI